ncbi:MAG: 30S ribosomal protein S8, partial [Patescibacteria group bacterium]
SKPSRRLYIGYQDLKPVKSGYGHALISTSKGVMTGMEAKKKKLGGELLFEIW